MATCRRIFQAEGTARVRPERTAESFAQDWRSRGSKDKQPRVQGQSITGVCGGGGHVKAETTGLWEDLGFPLRWEDRVSVEALPGG